MRDAGEVRLVLTLATVLTGAAISHAQEALPSVPERTNIPAPDEVRIVGLTQESQGTKYRGRGGVTVETAEMRLQADEMDYDQETGEAEARGHVKYVNFARRENIEADKVTYDLNEQTGKFYNVKGQAAAKIEARPGVLTTNNPYAFTCEWAERQKDRYVCHNGTATNCKLPNPWWVLKGPTFDIIPEDRAVSRNSVFWLRGIPIFYTPYFYKSLKRAPRRSGILTPNIGNSSRRGKMVGGGYYWAINRSYDAMYRGQWFTERGFAHHVDIRGKPTRRSDFDYTLYGVNDSGRPDNKAIKEGGYLMSFLGKVEMSRGFAARADINYLSSFRFRQAFTESFYEAIYSQVNSVAYITRQWSTFSFDGTFQSNAYFPTTLDTDQIAIRKLPSVEFRSRDREINRRVLPVWVSFDSSFALMRRNQLLFQTRRFVERLDFAPRISTSLRWKDFHLVPYASIRATDYGSSYETGGGPRAVVGDNLFRNSQEFGADLRMPSLARVYDVDGWFGPKLKHVIEPRASFRYVTGIDDFNQIIRFDEVDILTNTSQVEIGFTNRFYRKAKDGNVTEVLSWDLMQQRYFNPTFGGAVVDGQRNMIQSSAELTGFTFFDGPRNYSPLISTLRFNPIWTLGVEWRADYDPLQQRFLSSTVQANARVSKVNMWLGHNQVSLPWVKANQLQGMVGIGQENRHGWSAAFSANYDYRVSILQYATTQISYNSDCCGFSVQWRLFDFGTRQENQFRVAFAVANIGSFGTLKRQERIF